MRNFVSDFMATKKPTNLSKKPTKRRHKRAPRKKSKTGLKIYLGIFLCLFVIIAVVALGLSNLSNKPKSNLATSTQPNLIDPPKIAPNKPTPIKSNKPISENITKLTEEDINELLNIKAPKTQIPQFSHNDTQNNSVSENLIIPNSNIQNSADLPNLNNDTNQTKPPKKPSKHKKTAKLAIIIDDIAWDYQMKAINSLNLRITPSILPPTKEHPNSAKLAKGIDYYMVHLPLSALYFKKNEQHTLDTNSSNYQIYKRISEIKAIFPNPKYLNNHTGSEFTSNYASTKILLSALKMNKIKFVDSLTTSKSQVQKVSKELNLPYVYRDIFLDNEQNVNYTLKQIQKAVQTAHKNGHAIAIGHPHKTTIEALNIAKKSILKEVEIVYLKDIYGLYN